MKCELMRCRVDCGIQEATAIEKRDTEEITKRRARGLSGSLHEAVWWTISTNHVTHDINLESISDCLIKPRLWLLTSRGTAESASVPLKQP